jgi:cytochrome c553
MRWVKRIGLGLVALVVVALAIVYGGSEWTLRRGHSVALPQIAADRTPAGLAAGARFAAVMGCRGCHGPNGNGRLLVDVPGVIHAAAPALAPRVATYSDAELARLIRHGIKRDGTALYVMPIDGHARIADDDLARIIAWLRTLKPSPADRPDGLSFGPVGRLAVLTGGIKPQYKVGTEAPAHRPTDTGQYLVDSACGSCHALRQQREAHDDGRPVPALAQIGPAYDLPAFQRLLRTGKGLSPRDLGLMASVAKDDLSHLTDAEIAAIHRYLRSEGAKPGS